MNSFCGVLRIAMKSICAYLLLILMMNEVVCYETFIPELNTHRNDVFHVRKDLHRFKRVSWILPKLNLVENLINDFKNHT